MKIELLIEVDLSSFAFDVKNEESIKYFKNNVLLNKTEDGGLVLHSNEIGDEIGTVKVFGIFGLPQGDIFICQGCNSEIDPSVCSCGGGQ